LGAVERMAADNGYFSQHNVEIVVNNGIEPLIAVGRQSHHETLAARLAPVPDAPQNPDAVTAMKHRLKTPEVQACYAKRKTTSEPVFGIIKEVMGFRRFLLRGLDKVKGEWRLVCLAFNLKRLCVLNQGVTASRWPKRGWKSIQFGGFGPKKAFLPPSYRHFLKHMHII
jgi:hypothetical protein